MDTCLCGAPMQNGVCSVEGCVCASTQHTPGPWHLNRAIRGKLYVEALEPVVICDMQREYVDTAAQGLQCEADAQLIAAAPDLLAACRGIIGTYVYLDSMTAGSDLHDNTVKALAAVRAAIAKAEGGG